MASFDLEEGILRLGPSARSLVLVTNAAEIEIRLESTFDTQRKHGASKARPRFTGFKPAEIEARWIVMPDEEDDFWRNVVPLLRPRSPKAEAPPLEIVNLQANRAGIKKILLTTSRIGTPNARDGREVSAQFREWTLAPIDPTKQKPVEKPSELDSANTLERII